MLQTAQMRPGLLAKQNISENEILAYSTGQGSPLPGETASPRSCFQTPCLPDSGLTEFNVASPKIAPLSSGKQQKMSALTGKLKTLSACFEQLLQTMFFTSSKLY